MVNTIFTCESCNNKFSFNEALNSNEECSIYYNIPYHGWSTIDLGCPKCGERITKEIEREIID
jgi:transcription initiation factor IIE alpha subunit